jgi:hypothetical protein
MFALIMESTRSEPERFLEFVKEFMQDNNPKYHYAVAHLTSMSDEAPPFKSGYLSV